jgi:predicted transcriptional regulator
MTEPIPKWLMREYAFLWNRFREKEFDHREACEALRDEEATVSLALSDMKKAGWLEVRVNPKIPARGSTGSSVRRRASGP